MCPAASLTTSESLETSVDCSGAMAIRMDARKSLRQRVREGNTQKLFCFVFLSLFANYVKLIGFFSFVAVSEEFAIERTIPPRPVLTDHSVSQQLSHMGASKRPPVNYRLFSAKVKILSNIFNPHTGSVWTSVTSDLICSYFTRCLGTDVLRETLFSASLLSLAFPYQKMLTPGWISHHKRRHYQKHLNVWALLSRDVAQCKYLYHHTHLTFGIIIYSLSLLFCRSYHAVLGEQCFSSAAAWSWGFGERGPETRLF